MGEGDGGRVREERCGRVAYGYGVCGVADGDYASLWMYPLLEERPLDHGDADDGDRLLGQRDESVGRGRLLHSACILTRRQARGHARTGGRSSLAIGGAAPWLLVRAWCPGRTARRR